jgi:hypothetical protein
VDGVLAFKASAIIGAVAIAIAASSQPVRSPAVAKGQKKSNKEVRKPKQDKPKPVAAAPSFLTPPSKKK